MLLLRGLSDGVLRRFYLGMPTTSRSCPPELEKYVVAFVKEIEDCEEPKYEKFLNLVGTVSFKVCPDLPQGVTCLMLSYK